MTGLAADENFNNKILEGVRRRKPDLDIVRVQDTTLSGSDDSSVLAWSANEGRILLTHDVNTMPGFAYQRVVAGLPMPGVVVVSRYTPLARVIEDLVLLIECSLDGEWEGQVVHLPLRKP